MHLFCSYLSNAGVFNQWVSRDICVSWKVGGITEFTDYTVTMNLWFVSYCVIRNLIVILSYHCIDYEIT